MTQFSEWLSRQMRLRGWEDNKSMVATYTGIKYATVSAWFNRDTKPAYANCVTIATKMRIPLNEVLVAAGYPPESAPDDSPAEPEISLPPWLIEAIKGLNEAELETVRDTALSLHRLRDLQAPLAVQPDQADDEPPPAPPARRHRSPR